MAILRSFVICRAALTLQRTPAVALISSFTARKKKKKGKATERWRETERERAVVLVIKTTFMPSIRAAS